MRLRLRSRRFSRVKLRPILPDSRAALSRLTHPRYAPARCWETSGEPMVATAVTLPKEEAGRIYVWIASLFIVFLLAGFGPTYLLAVPLGKFEGPVILHVHGALFFAWPVLFLVQASLAARGNLRLHRSFGLLGVRDWRRGRAAGEARTAHALREPPAGRRRPARSHGAGAGPVPVEDAVSRWDDAHCARPARLRRAAGGARSAAAGASDAFTACLQHMRGYARRSRRREEGRGRASAPWPRSGRRLKPFG
jgi:hypothetical protein